MIRNLLRRWLLTKENDDAFVSPDRVRNYPTDIRITSADNGFVIEVVPKDYDVRPRIYVANCVDELKETLVLALVNRQIDSTR